MRTKNDLIIYILSYGRTSQIPTLQTLNKFGMLDIPVKIVIGNDDPQIDNYIKNYGEAVLVFDKHDYLDVDLLINGKPSMRKATYARNFILDHARKNGYRYIGMADDDIVRLRHRFVSDGKLMSTDLKNPSIALMYLVNLLKVDNLSAISLSHAATFRGPSSVRPGIKPNLVQFFLVDVEKFGNFKGDDREDSIKLTETSKYPKLEVRDICIDSPPPGSNGIVYEDFYAVNFRCILCQPSFYKVRGSSSNLKILKDLAFPKIISSEVSK